MAGKSLGPFPKTLRWREIAGADADASLLRAIGQVGVLAKDADALQATILIVSRPVASRYSNPVQSSEALYGTPSPSGFAAESAGAAIDAHLASCQVSAGLFDADPWDAWRRVDGPAFCDFVRVFYARLLGHVLAECCPAADRQLIDRFAHEASVITRSFSARWFKACATEAPPDEGSIAWYLGHCLGKLELELSRELSDWVEPTGNPWKRRKPVGASLGI